MGAIIVKVIQTTHYNSQVLISSRYVRKIGDVSVYNTPHIFFSSTALAPICGMRAPAHKTSQKNTIREVSFSAIFSTDPRCNYE